MPFAPVLHRVAARLGGVPVATRTDPVRWAYRLREAADTVEVDWLITHHDPQLERDALPPDDVDPAHVALEERPPVTAALSLTETLRRLSGSRPVAASVTGPIALERAVRHGVGQADPDRLLDCADLVAALVRAYVGAGSTRLLVWEPGDAADDRPDLADAHGPLQRVLDAARVTGVRCDPHTLVASPMSASQHGRACLVGPERFTEGARGDEPPRWWSEAVRGEDAAEPLVLSAGPVPEDADVTALRAVGRRPRDRAHHW